MSQNIEALTDHTIGFIGCGAMARALAGGLVAAGVASDRLRGADVADASRKAFEEELGIATLADNDDLVAASDTLVVCVKPHIVEPVLADLDPRSNPGEKLWVSPSPSTTATLTPSRPCFRTTSRTASLRAKLWKLSCIFLEKVAKHPSFMNRNGIWAVGASGRVAFWVPGSPLSHVF